METNTDITMRHVTNQEINDQVDATLQGNDTTPTTPSGNQSDEATCSVSSDFDQWWEREGESRAECSTEIQPYELPVIRELCRTAWSNGADKMRMSFSAERKAQPPLITKPTSR